MATNTNNIPKLKTEDAIRIYLENKDTITSEYESMKAEVEQEIRELEENDFMSDPNKRDRKEEKKGFDQRVKAMKKLAGKQKALEKLERLEKVRPQIENLEQLRQKDMTKIREIKRELDGLTSLKEAEEKDSTLDKEIRAMQDRAETLKREIKSEGISDEDKKEKQKELEKLESKDGEIAKKQDERAKNDGKLANLREQYKGKSEGYRSERINKLKKDLNKHAGRLVKVETSMYRLITGQVRDSKDITNRLMDWKASEKQINDTIERTMSSNEEEHQEIAADVTQVMQAQPTTRLPRLAENPTRLEMIINKIEEKHPKIAGFIRKITRKSKENQHQNIMDPVHGEQEQVQEEEQEMTLDNAVENVLNERNISPEIAMLLRSYRGYYIPKGIPKVGDRETVKDAEFIGSVAEHGYKDGIKKYQEQIKEQLAREKTEKQKEPDGQTR